MANPLALATVMTLLTQSAKETKGGTPFSFRHFPILHNYMDSTTYNPLSAPLEEVRGR